MIEQRVDLRRKAAISPSLSETRFSRELAPSKVQSIRGSPVMLPKFGQLVAAAVQNPVAFQGNSFKLGGPASKVSASRPERKLTVSSLPARKKAKV